jgi:hypothetical protein
MGDMDVTDTEIDTEDDSPFDFDDTEDNDEDTDQERIEFLEIIERIKIRCEKVDLRIQEDTGGMLGINYDIFIPEEKGERRVTIWDKEEAETLESLNFENFRFIKGFQAYYSIKTGSINAQINLIVPFSSGVLEFSRLTRSKKILDAIANVNTTEKVKQKTLYLSVEDSNVKIGITLLRESDSIFFSRNRDSKLCLKILHTSCRRHDEIKELLENVSNSLFLQIQSETGISLAISRSDTSVVGYIDRQSTREELPSYVFPDIEYNKDPMTFYWYGVGAYMMPLMQYLAFYQAIEYFYPVYSEYQMKRSVQGILKSPSFRVDRDSDVIKILKTVRGSSGRGYGSEINQLKATIKECVGAEDLRDFMKSLDGRGVFSSKKITKHRIVNFNSSSIDIVSEVCDRIYEIRCRIVHTKVSDNDSDSAPLLPYTTEESNLTADISLVKFLALKVISHGGANMKL